MPMASIFRPFTAWKATLFLDTIKKIHLSSQPRRGGRNIPAMGNAHGVRGKSSIPSASSMGFVVIQQCHHTIFKLKMRCPEVQHW